MTVQRVVAEGRRIIDPNRRTYTPKDKPFPVDLRNPFWAKRARSGDIVAPEPTATAPAAAPSAAAPAAAAKPASTK
ncbi:hypothetical protein [Komagataeibacter xylinus]|uniref:hypothetical protein n=1 Tax=Komagataeibacter xylinus TaxID=28448 RepID=UPI00280A920A|nr:hypothetical protein [Komagataeibacter xylinus]